MTYAELREAVLTDTHRPRIASLIPRFVSQCEGMIRRQVTAFPLHTTLTESNRIGEGRYSLPSGVQVVRTIRPVENFRYADGLIRVSIDALNRTPVTNKPEVYSIVSPIEIDIRGTPAENTVLDLFYKGQPEPLVNDADTNQLLTDHFMLYLAGTKFQVYLYTQDRELAQDELQIFNGVVDGINELTTRQLGGAQVAGTYNFAGGSTY